MRIPKGQLVTKCCNVLVAGFDPNRTIADRTCSECGTNWKFVYVPKKDIIDCYNMTLEPNRHISFD